MTIENIEQKEQDVNTVPATEGTTNSGEISELHSVGSQEVSGADDQIERDIADHKQRIEIHRSLLKQINLCFKQANEPCAPDLFAIRVRSIVWSMGQWFEYQLQEFQKNWPEVPVAPN